MFILQSNLNIMLKWVNLIIVINSYLNDETTAHETWNRKKKNKNKNHT